MTTLDTALEIAVIGGIPTLAGLLLHARSKNRKLNAEASHLGTEDVKVISATAMQMLSPLREQLDEAQAECKELRKQVKELSAEVEAQRLIINETTLKLTAANRRADYFQHAFEDRAGSEGAS